MLLDHKQNRPSELDVINGIVSVMGKELNIPTPYNNTLTAILHQREVAFKGATS
jgi:2-dehydropantoate 2-reductase